MKEEDPEAWAEGERVGGHEVVREVGRGGMAVVYEARHRELGSRAAIKVLLGDRAQRPEVRARFVREGIAVARVHHAHVVRVFDAGEHRGRAYLLMEFVEGQSLRARLTKAPPMAVERALELMLPVVAAVAAAHDAGVIHRDLKPANIMLERLRDGGTRPVVVDFGIAQLDDADGADGGPSTRSGAIVGTPAYLSPEQARHDDAASPASDQWSTAVTLYECLTGRRAFPGSSVMEVLARVARSDFEAPRAVRPELPEALEAVILRAMQDDPARRHRSMRAFGRELLPFASERVRLLWERTFVSDDDVTNVHGVLAPPAIEPAPEAPAATPQVALVPIAPPPAPRGWESPRRSLHGATWAASWLALAGLSAAASRCVLGASHPPYRAAVMASPARATITVDGAHAAAGSFAREYPADGVAHELRVSAPGCETREETFVNAPPSPQVTLRCRGETTTPRPPTPVAEPPAETPLASARPPETDAPRAHGGRTRRGRRAPRGRDPETTTRPTEPAPPDPPATIGTGGTVIM